MVKGELEKEKKKEKKKDERLIFVSKMRFFYCLDSLGSTEPYKPRDLSSSGALRPG
jgi:hypothetical protein